MVPGGTHPYEVRRISGRLAAMKSTRPSGADRATRGAAPSEGQPHDRRERRRFVQAGLAFCAMLLVVVVAATVFSGGAGDERRASTGTTVACAPDDTVCEAAQGAADPPSIIPRPGSGRAPEDPGDRGGWEQVALLGVVVGALALIAALVVRSARRGRGRGDQDSEQASLGR